MADEKLSIPSWLGRFALGGLRELIDEGIEEPGIGEALKSRKAAMLKAAISVVRMNLPTRPKFQQLDILPPPFGKIADIAEVRDPGDVQSGLDQALEAALWLDQQSQLNWRQGLLNVTKAQYADP